jgi:hypothetical protein
MMVMATRPQLMGIAHHGWRLRVDTRWLGKMLYWRDPMDMSDEQAHEFLMFLAEQDGPAALGSAIYDWQEHEE